MGEGGNRPTPTNSLWASPIVIVPKKKIVLNKETRKREEIIVPRFCIDYRELNKITKKDRFPIPQIDDLFDIIVQEPEYFSNFDLLSGFH